MATARQKPSVERVRALSDELSQLSESGRLTKADFQRICRAGSEPDVCGDYVEDVLEGFAIFAGAPNWFDADQPAG